MGIGTSAFAINLDRLRGVFGSKDSDLKVFMESRYKNFIHEYEERIEDGKPWLREALGDIIAGEIQHPERAVYYVWATEILCHHLGKELEPGDVGWLDDLELGTGLENSGPPLPIPRHEDSPLLGFLSAEHVAKQYERLKDRDLSHEDDDIEVARRTVLSWFRVATEEGKALISLTQG